jgi:DNA-binding LytR/AlgR family response regulator
LDIILIPEHADDVTGLKFAQEIRKVKKYQFTPIVFITALGDPRLYSYSYLHCWKYIEKPFNVEQVQQTVLEALDFPIEDDMERSVYFRKDGIIFAKKLKDIIYIEDSRRKILVYCKNDVIEVPYNTFDKILKELDTKQFIQCSRYVIINKSYISEIDYSNLYIKLKHVDKSIEIGKILKSNLREELS